MEVSERIAKPPSSSSSMASVWAVAERRFATTKPDVGQEHAWLKQAQDKHSTSAVGRAPLRHFGRGDREKDAMFLAQCSERYADRCAPPRYGSWP
eukprot:6108372-Prymnesium_polylepis.1